MNRTQVYRISTPKRAGDLSGTGAKLYGGRWNSVGQPVVYLAENISLAMLEVMVHAEPGQLRSSYSISVVEIPEKIQIDVVSQKSLPAEWNSFPFHPGTAKQGDEWLEKAKSAVLKVPSAVNPHEHIFLLNPQHPDFKLVSISDIRTVSFDYRLLEIGAG